MGRAYVYVSFEPCNQQFVDTYPVKLRYKEDPFNFKYCLRSEFWRSTLNLCQNLFTFNDLWYRLFFKCLNHYFFNGITCDISLSPILYIKLSLTFLRKAKLFREACGVLHTALFMYFQLIHVTVVTVKFCCRK